MLGSLVTFFIGGEGMRMSVCDRSIVLLGVVNSLQTNEQSISMILLHRVRRVHIEYPQNT